MSKSLTKFDYGKLDKPKLLYYAGQFAKAMNDHTSAGLRVGAVIAEAHGLFADRGAFARWVECELNISRQTAYNYMWAWQRFGGCKSLLQLSSEAMYALAAPTAPAEAAQEAANLADRGQRIDKKNSKELIDIFSDKTPPTNGKPRKSEPPVTVTAVDVTPAKPGATVTEEPADDGPLNDEPEKELSFADQVKAANSRIDAFCRQLVKCFEDGCPKLLSVDHLGRYDSALAQVKAACSTLRTCKYHDEPCPKCQGDGCSKCQQESDFGAVTVLTYKQLAG